MDANHKRLEVFSLAVSRGQETVPYLIEDFLDCFSTFAHSFYIGQGVSGSPSGKNLAPPYGQEKS